MAEERLIDDILKHLDSETKMGVMRMSVEMDEKAISRFKCRISAAVCTGGPPTKR